MANVTIGATQTAGKTTGTLSNNLSHTIDAGSDGVLLVRIARQATLSSVTAGGNAMTLIRSDNSGGFETDAYYMTGLSSGAITINITFSSISTFASFIATNLYGCDTTTVVNTSNTTAVSGQTGNESCAVTTTRDGCMVLDMVMGNNSANTPSNTLDTYQSDGPSNRAGYFQHGLQATAGSITLSWTLAGGTFTGATVVAINSKPVASGGFLLFM